MMQFTPLKDFFSPEMQSQYSVGLSYSVKPDAAHAKLAGLIDKWVAEGKIRLGGPEAATKARVVGSGEVSNS